MYILSGYFDFGSYVLYLTALFLIFQTVRTVDIEVINKKLGLFVPELITPHMLTLEEG